MQKIKVLDKGFIEYLNHMGSDRENAEAGWTSTGRCENREDWEVERVVNFMGRNGHWTAMAQNALKFRIKMPVCVARQLMKSNVGFVWNEESRRMTTDEVEWWDVDEWFGPPTGKNRQGRGDRLDDEKQVLCSQIQQDSSKRSVLEYNKLLDHGAAPELARSVLPLNMYTICVFTTSLVGAARLYSLRANKDAQWESQQYAKAMGDIAKQYFPISWEALVGGE
jgi:thymidylate synthase (FAD)